MKGRLVALQYLSEFKYDGMSTEKFDLMKTFSLILVAILFTAILAGSAGAAQIVVFTDKKVYADWYSDGRQSGGKPVFLSDNTPAQTPYIYAIFLDDNGSIMKGQSLSVTIKDIARLDHYDKGTDAIHHNRTNTSGAFYNITASLYDDGTNGDKNTQDGIYTYQWTPATRRGSTLIDDHLLINITATSGSLRANETILFSWVNCHKGDQDPHPSTHSLTEGQPALDGCTQCHIGFEHTYENKSNGINELGKDVHFGRMKPIVPAMAGKGNPNFEWNLSGQQSPNGYGTSAWDVVYPGSQYCYWCHYNSNGGAILDYGANRGARSNINLRPSCSQASVTLSLGTVTCHATTEIEGTTVSPWEPAGVPASSNAGYPLTNINDAKSHNHTTTIPANVSCSTCHGSTHSLSMPNMSSNISAGGNINAQCWLCHSGDGPSVAPHDSTTTNCKSCHYNAVTKIDAHLVPKGKSGGRNCTGCHDIGMGTEKVDVNKMNTSTSIHVNLNSNATNGSSPGVNKQCWGCHTNNTLSADNRVNQSELPPDGDHPIGYDTPKKCSDCHIQPKFGALIVSEHYSASLDINTKNYSNVNDSCINCHNKSEMMISNLDPGGPKSQYANVSHYGSNKTNTAPYNLGGNANCSYCHNKTGTNNFTSEMVDPAWNASIKNHSNQITNPSCDDCHSTGRIHDSTLLKPKVNTTLCTSSGCHNTLQKHNNSLDCAQCHLENNRSIHPVQYLQVDKTWKRNSPQNKSTAVNCTNCHQNKTFWTGSPVAPIIPEPLKHSSNRSNGSLWNITLIPFWTTEDGSCNYCHNNTKHNLTAMGRISSLMNSGNVRNGNLATTGWCSDCHYNASANANYRGNQWNPAPPLITVNNTDKSRWVNHSGYLTQGYNDSKCVSCHTLNGSYSSTSLNYSHSLDEGIGSSCIDCHQFPVTGPSGTYPAVNITNFGKHNNVNKTGGNNSLTDDDCTTCHYNFDFDLMNQAGFGTPTRVCTDCHTSGTNNATIISNHKPNGANISTAASCSVCHNNSISMFAYNTNASVGHYSTNTSLIDTANCITCHKNSTNATKWGNATDPWNSLTFPHSIANTPKEDCYACHNNVSATSFHNATLIKPTILTVTCIACHTTNRTMAPKEVDAGVFNTGVHKNRACENCHANATDTNMNGTYLLANDAAKPCTYCHTGPGNFSAPLVGEHTQVGKEVITATATCNTCHDNSGMYLPNTGTNGNGTAISHYVKDITNRTTNPYLHNGPINTSNCISCHKNATYTNNASWGSPVNISTSSKRAHTETLTSQCDGCHNDNPASSLGKVDFHNASVKLADMENCIGCHTDPQGPTGNPTKYPGISNTSFGRHINVNTTEGGSNNLTNGDCKTCHYNTTNMSAVLTRVCENCHTGSGVPNATLINNHRNNNSVNISTTNVQCSTCHNNSINMFAYNANASSGHYLTNTSLVDTTNCVTCHKNSTNGTKWGGASDPKNSPAFPHTINSSTKQDCYACHANVSATSFHNISLQKPALSSVNCLDCHKTTATMAPKKIDASVIASGSHNNSACEDCHTNATDSNMDSYSLTTDPAPICKDCHTGSGSLGAPIVSEHNELGQQVTTGATCTTCHNNSGMYLANSGTNGSSSAITHYIKDVTNLATSPYGHSGTIDTSNCIICHNGAYTNNASWGSPVNISTSSKRIHTETLTSQCNDCHKDSNITSLANVDFHNASVQPASSDNCLGCHQSSTGPADIYAAINTGIFGKHENVNTTGGPDTLNNGDCTTCHNNFNYTVMSQIGFTTPTKVCTDCHTSGQYGATVIDNHKPNGANISTSAYCSSCHNNSVAMYAYSQNASAGHYGTKTGLIATTDCTTCHKNTETGTLWGNAADPANSGTFPHSIATTPTGDCYACHNSASDFHNISLQKPAISSVNCLDCHKTSATMAPKKIDASVIASGSHNNSACEDCHAGATDSNMNTYSFTSDPAKTCTLCHTGSGQYNAPLVVEHITGAACTTCHSNGGMYLDNSGTNGSTTAITHYIKDVTNLATSPYGHSGTIDTSNCITCHNGAYTENVSWGTPVNISTSSKRIHTETLTSQCDNCHKESNISSFALVDFHYASVKASDNCLGCHESLTGPDGIYAAINASLFGKHENVNTTGGNDTLTKADCTTCHYNFNFSVMNQSGFTTPTKECIDCHTSGSNNATIISNHRPNAAQINTTAYCSSCHNNSVNMYTFSENASTGHYGTTTNLVKPTAGTYNTACNICHNSATNKTLYGVENKQVTLGHTSAATCDECHVNSTGSADTLHNVSLEMPVTNVCLVCHTTNADKYGAPNLSSTPMAGYSTCNCHGGDSTGSLDTLASHNVDRTYAGTGGSTDTVYLNGQISLPVTKGAIVNITSRVNDRQKTGGASRIGGAEYYIGTDPGQGKGTPMVAADGYFDALQTTWENVTATIDTSSLSGGTYTIYVRGMDIGKQWSATKNATLIVQAFGYINGTVTNGTGTLISGVYVSTIGDNDTTGSDGNYSLMVSDGNYTVNASKQPEFYDYTVADKTVTPLNTTTVDIVMDQKPTGIISGVLRNV